MDEGRTYVCVGNQRLLSEGLPSFYVFLNPFLNIGKRVTTGDQGSMYEVLVDDVRDGRGGGWVGGKEGEKEDRKVRRREKKRENVDIYSTKRLILVSLNIIYEQPT